MKQYVYRCIRCGEVFDAPSPAMHLLWMGQLVEHCEQRAVVVHVGEVRPCGRDVSASAQSASSPFRSNPENRGQDHG